VTLAVHYLLVWSRVHQGNSRYRMDQVSVQARHERTVMHRPSRRMLKMFM
jgi:hypothetical protein